MTSDVRAGVLGVGQMGQHHARVYRELPETTLVGVHDADRSRAAEVADEYGTSAVGVDALVDDADVVSVALPTEHHFEAAKRCLEADVDVLVEKPFVSDLDDGRRLVELAEERNRVLQVGHIERFNPVTSRLLTLVDELDIIAVTARRLGPPVDRDISDTVVMDLMIHDIDVLLAMLDDDVAGIDASGVAAGGYATATLEFESGVLCQLTASRVTQEKVRELTISATNCRVKVDYIDQTLHIYRQSLPEYVRNDGDVRYHHKNVVEQVNVQEREPLKNELAAFVEAATTDAEPTVTGREALRALEVTRTVDRLASQTSEDEREERAVSGASTRS